MAQRQTAEQAEHDLVIEAAAEQFATSAKYAIYTNPGSERRTGIGRHYPDILVMEKGTTRVRYIIEVETIDTIESSELGHWRELAGLGPPLYLVVPQVSLSFAQQLCRAGNVRCRFGYYHRASDGRLRVVLLREGGPPSQQSDLRAKFAALRQREGR